MAYKAYSGSIRPVGHSGMASAKSTIVFAKSAEEARGLLIKALGKTPKQVIVDATAEAMHKSWAIRNDLRDKGLFYLSWGEFDFNMKGVPLGFHGGLGEIIEAYDKFRELNGGTE